MTPIDAGQPASFDFKKAFWGAVLLDGSGRVAHRWYMNAQIAELSDNPDVLKNLYGVAFFPNGSAVFNMQKAGGGLVKIDLCSQVEWTKKGLFHHAISPTEDYSAFWTFGGMEGDLHPKLLLIDAASGTLGVRLQLPNPDSKIPAGIRCSVVFGK